MNPEWAPYLTAFLSIVGTSCVFLTFQKSARRDAREEGKHEGSQSAMILTELGYIKSGIEDIKLHQKEQDKNMQDIVTRLVVVESKTDRAHKRIDQIENRRNEE